MGKKKVTLSRTHLVKACDVPLDIDGCPFYQISASKWLHDASLYTVPLNASKTEQLRVALSGNV